MNLKSLYRQSVELLKTSGTLSPELDARVLISHVLGVDTAFILSHTDFEIGKSQKRKILNLIKRRQKGEPIAYITGHKEFFGLDFLVNRNVLIPRPESEFLVEEGLKFLLNSKSQIPNPKFSILDLGTGSGCLIISLILELEKQYNNLTMQQFAFSASDISAKALAVAKKNADRLLPRSVISTHFESTVGWAEKGEKSQHFEKNITIKFVHSDLLSNPKLHTKYDLILANLPYVPFCHFDSPTHQSGAEKSFDNHEISRLANAARDDRLNDISFEPSSAIFAADNGTAIIKRFLQEVNPFLQQTSLLLLEVDPRNAKELLNYSKNIFANAKIELKKDLAGLDRYLIISTPQK